MKFCRIIFCLWLLVCFFPIGIHADIQLPSILSDNMVLQQNAKVRFWGKARPVQSQTSPINILLIRILLSPFNITDCPEVAAGVCIISSQ
jgi:hypothetical protein